MLDNVEAVTWVGFWWYLLGFVVFFVFGGVEGDGIVLVFVLIWVWSVGCGCLC